jgi:hypothetical protein
MHNVYLPGIAFAVLLVSACPAWCQPQVALVVPGELPTPVGYGVSRLEQSLRAKGFAVTRTTDVASARGDFVILAGTSAGQSAAASALQTLKVALPSGPETLTVQRDTINGAPALILCGGDARGLMYAALDTAERVAWGSDPADPLQHMRNVSEVPYLRERGISIYTMQRAYFERRLYDEEYWKQYFDLLASSRINSFVVIFGYENGGFMAPPYPYFFDVEQFPDVRLVGLKRGEQERNTAAFRAMIRLAHERGIEVTVAIWDHIYRGGVQAGGIPGASRRSHKRVPGLVWGVNAENLAAYTKAALRRFLEVFPEIDAIQFRMHDESGLKRGEMQGFWHDVFGMMRQIRPTLRLDLRAKELPDSIIEDALNQGLNARVSTKYWMEQMGLPFHPTHVNRQNQHDRRHSYADLLRYPRKYRVHWQLWSGGTTRLLLWSDPDYVRRFAASARLYDGDSFEVNEMLATFMLGEPHDQPTVEILDPRYRYYKYEFERYWAFYRVWGRASYNPQTPPEVWEREFERRFGQAAGAHLMKALNLASKVLPRIVAASYRYQYFPTTRGWAEMMHEDDLAKYAAEEGSDVQQFMNLRDEARSILEGSDTAMRRPEETSRWFAEISDEILRQVADAEKSGGDRNEFRSTVTDLKILAALARYHSWRLRSGVSFNLYRETGDLFSFDDAIEFEKRAIESWTQLVAAAGDVYSQDLPFGVHRVGFSRHWKEELQYLLGDLEKLLAARSQARPRVDKSAPLIAHVPLRKADGRSPLSIRVTVGSRAAIEEVSVVMSGPDANEVRLPMREQAPGMYAGEIRADTNEGRIRYYIEALDAAGHRACYPPGGKIAPVWVTVTADNQPPRVQLMPVLAAEPGRDLRVAARVEDPAGVKSVRLRFRHLTQYEDYQSLDMTLDAATGLYAARIPASFIVPTWDLMFFVEVLDNHGNGRMYPDLEMEMPYVVVSVKR